MTMVAVAMALMMAVSAWASSFRLGAGKAWELGSSEQREMARNRDSAWQLEDKTECYSGNDLYESKKIFCDAECVQEFGRSARCNGPWYCSKTKVCQKFHRPERGANEERVERDCVEVRSCANHSQCFPSVDQADRQNVLLDPNQWDSKRQVQAKGYDIEYAGASTYSF